MKLEGVQKSWEKLGETDPISAMLPADLRGRISGLEEFFASGQREIDDLMKYVTSLGINLERKKALDFGCGLGRCSQALAGYFDEVYGVDIASSMIELANKYNRDSNKCRYLVNQTNDLQIFENNSVDFVWSYGVLHLVEPHYFRDYIKEFLRVLVPGGLAVFHQSAEPAETWKGAIFRVTPTTLLNFYRRAKYGFEVHGMRREQVLELLDQTGGTVLDVHEDRRTPGPNWRGFQYCVLKNPK